ncbi:succinate semialdehyde dehydrogenase [Micromonospora cremea]|uniref:Succinate semialdehyde dehydrogenase n=1 Tax=Micromonospora cremea TaxID=709881 RepID=A0A1N5UF27_9ACTN|nr:succinate semialdehyde dehydrogenase [Micromonospora cremea]
MPTVVESPGTQHLVDGTAEAKRLLLSSVPTGSFIGGQWVSTDATFDVRNPSTGQPLAAVTDAGPAHGMDALAAASRAQDRWAAVPPRTRGEILLRVHDLLHKRADDFAMLMALEMGKTISEARGEVGYGAEFFRWFSEEAVRVGGGYSQSPTGGSRILTIRQPVGPVLAITPWNFPLAMGARKIAPALAAGCTVVVKPSELAPLTTLALAQVLVEAGVPDGVVNVVTTSRAGGVAEPLIRDQRLRKLTFTGSTAVGKRLIAQSADSVLRVSMELGGNAPFIVFDDVDLDAAVEGALLAKMRNGGQACTAANRFLVHEAVVEQFSQRLADRMSALLVGSATDEETQAGPLVSEAAVRKVERLVSDAATEGARVLTGGCRLESEGFFYAPTVLIDVPVDARLQSEEIFGPVAPITSFSDDEQATALANDTQYGLAAYIFTRDLNKAIRLAERLETGMVGINQGVISNPAAPFGGMKASGLGREGGTQGIEEYLESKYVGIAFS